jgi:hypothetical protein
MRRPKVFAPLNEDPLAANVVALDRSGWPRLIACSIHYPFF